MRVWYDTEFIERGPSLPIELVSMGMVREDGETLYLINADASLSTLVRHPWLQINVVPYLPIKTPGQGILEWDVDHEDFHRVWALDSIAERVLEFCCPPGHTASYPELWAYFGAYDHVVLAQMFGTMADYPPAMPMFTHDVMQEWIRLGRPRDVLPDKPLSAHHALHDAQWVRDAWQALQEYDPSPEDAALLDRAKIAAATSEGSITYDEAALAELRREGEAA